MATRDVRPVSTQPDFSQGLQRRPHGDVSIQEAGVRGPTPQRKVGIALIFRQFDRSPRQDEPADYFVAWVPPEREQELDRWLAFFSGELQKRRDGVSSEQTRAIYSFGNPYKPFGIGGFVVELHLDDSVHLVHNRLGVSRTWFARALPSLWKAFNIALGSSGFPAEMTKHVAPAGTDSFSLRVIRSHSDATVSGFGSPEYKDINVLFGDIVAQMSGEEVATPYVMDVREI